MTAYQRLHPGEQNHRCSCPCPFQGWSSPPRGSSWWEVHRLPLSAQTPAASRPALYTVSAGLADNRSNHPPNLASSSFIFRRFEPMFLLRAGYSHSWRNLEQVLHDGLTRSHLSFRFRHDTQDMVFSIPFPSPAVVRPVGCDWLFSSGLDADPEPCSPGRSGEPVSTFAGMKITPTGRLGDIGQSCATQ